MIKQIGTKVYYCKITGNVIKIILDMQGNFIETNFDKDYEIYTELKERDKSKIGLLTFKYGEYPKLSANSTGVIVNLETNELEFSYEQIPMIPVFQSETKSSETVLTYLAIAETYEMNRDKVNISQNIVPASIQNIYQSLFNMSVKTLEEMPYEVRRKIKSK